jgi:hypothetical protein
MKGGTRALYTTRMKGRDADATRVRSQLLINATTYRPMTKARDWNSMAKCCDTASWTVLEDVVMRVETLPGLIVSMMLTGWAKRARRYARRRAADRRRPLMRMVI